MKNAFFLIIFMAVVLLMAGGQAGASNQESQAGSVTVTIEASKDNTIYGDEENYSNGSGEYFFAGRAAKTDFFPGPIRRGLIAFEDLSKIPAGAFILSVELTLNMSRTDLLTGPHPFALHKVRADWGEGASDAPGEEGTGVQAEPQDATWLHTFYDDKFWQVEGGDYEETASAEEIVDDEGSYTWSGPGMASDMRGWFSNPGSNFGWMMINESANKTAKRFDSRENGTVEFRPKLVVTYLPSDLVQRIYLPAIAN